MLIACNGSRALAHPGQDTRQFVALDVEWTKNYRIKHGSRPFCYSLCRIEVRRHASSLADLAEGMQFRSVYIHDNHEEPALLADLDEQLAKLDAAESVLCGHQLSSDLSVVLQASARPLAHVEAVYAWWRQRRITGGVVDTRYDTDHLVDIKSRRLVDVATALGLDVTQPELGRFSMTKLQQICADEGLVSDKLRVLNLRHSLSTALVAAMAQGWLRPGRYNVNDLLYTVLRDAFPYVQSEEFAVLLSDKCRRRYSTKSKA